MDSSTLSERYLQLTKVCDRLLRTPKPTVERTAIDRLHVLSQHPVHLEKYHDLLYPSAAVHRRGLGVGVGDYLFKKAYKTAAFSRNIWRSLFLSAVGRHRRGFSDFLSKLGQVDVVLVSWLVKSEHVSDADDFYFGRTQKLLADRGLSSLLVLRNQSGAATAGLAGAVSRDGSEARVLLPEALGLRGELDLIRRCFKERRILRRAGRVPDSTFERDVISGAAEAAATHATAANLRVRIQAAEVCRAVKPSIVMSLYEGHAWERMVFNGAKSIDPDIVGVGYQHTIIQEKAHALKRAVSLEKKFDPDVILTVGDVTADILQARRADHEAKIIPFGSYRRRADAGRGDAPSRSADILVLPEGIESECVFLFDFALECARRLPDTRFIFRTHPVLPFEKIRSKLSSGAIPGNVEVSNESSIDADFARSGYLFYRGSSTVIYAIMAGLMPYYVAKGDELDIDPIYELTTWRRRVASVDDLVRDYTAGKGPADRGDGDWPAAWDFCDRYVRPERPEALTELMETIGTDFSLSPQGRVDRDRL